MTKSPGPADYAVKPVEKTETRIVITTARRELIGDLVKKDVLPGPTDYNYDPNMQLRKNTRVMIPAAKKSSSLVPREVSPGP